VRPAAPKPQTSAIGADRVSALGRNAPTTRSRGLSSQPRLGAASSKLTLAGFALTLGLTGYLYVTIPKGFFPPQDNGRLFGLPRRRPARTFADHGPDLVEQMTAIIRADPDVASVTSYVGRRRRESPASSSSI
jgi:multidrug efflux pump subunit AcrB